MVYEWPPSLLFRTYIGVIHKPCEQKFELFWRANVLLYMKQFKKCNLTWVTLYVVCVLNSRTLALQKGPTPYTTIFVKDVSVCVRRVQQWWSAGPPPSFTGVRDRSKGGGRITIMAAIVVEHPAKLRSRPYSPLPTTFTEEERQGAYIVKLTNATTKSQIYD